MNARTFASALCAAVLAVACLAPAAPAAWADDSDDGNVVNPLQMPDNSFLYDTSIYDLINADPTYEGSTVQITGEVVGDAVHALEDPGKTWLTLSSTDEKAPGSISVLVDDDDVRLVDTYGAFGTTGTILRVKGTYHLSCGEHEGIMDVHADSVSAVTEGQTYHEEFNFDDFVPGIFVCAVGLVLSIAYYIMRERNL